ncbi:DNA phosphorothioation system sulfurtransferase DndC, partial [Erwinia amylovora]|nr:DNA phosphorothioation system sulfurtransferase DndC [Erwinia amylovora]
EKDIQVDDLNVDKDTPRSESATPAHVNAKQKNEGSRLARQTTLANAFIYTPIEAWDVEEVWKILRGAFIYSPEEIEECESPWG